MVFRGSITKSLSWAEISSKGSPTLALIPEAKQLIFGIQKEGSLTN